MKEMYEPSDDFRFYSFVAGLYLSPLQCGLQTAHAVSEMYDDCLSQKNINSKLEMFSSWAKSNKTIIICNALNSKGVIELYLKLRHYGDLLGLPCTLFREDEESLGRAATATAIIVPKKYYDVEFIKANPLDRDAAHARYVHLDGEKIMEYLDVDIEFSFISLLKSYRLV